jgi:hypothetical protein
MQSSVILLQQLKLVRFLRAPGSHTLLESICYTLLEKTFQNPTALLGSKKLSWALLNSKNKTKFHSLYFARKTKLLLKLLLKEIYIYFFNDKIISLLLLLLFFKSSK